LTVPRGEIQVNKCPRNTTTTQQQQTLWPGAKKTPVQIETETRTQN